MALSPQKFREIVFHLIYSSDFGDNEEPAVGDLIMNQLAVTKKSVREAQELKILVSENLLEIDEKIKAFSESYDFERIPRIERNILRLGVYELLFSSTIPPKVAISEAIRLTRKFATAEAATFVNAILDSIYQKKLEECRELPAECPTV